MDYPEDSAGGLMNTDIISVRPRHSLEVVMRYLRSKKALPKNTDKILLFQKMISILEIYLFQKYLFLNQL